MLVKPLLEPRRFDMSEAPWKLSPLRRIRRHLLHPSGLFQLVGSVACLGVYIAHLQDQAVSGGEALPLTVGNLGLPEQILRALGLPIMGPNEVSALLFALFAVAMFVATSRGQRPLPAKSALILGQMVIGLIHNNDLLLLLAAQLPVALSWRRALIFLGVQSIGLVFVWKYALFNELGHLPLPFAESTLTLESAELDLVTRIWGSLLLFAAWQTFAFGLGYIAMSERTQRDRLAASHAELQAMQQLLAESHRAAERLRIARDLHDGLGHHLTALSLHLELASRQLGSPSFSTEDTAAPRASIQTSREITQNLFAELRRAVNRERAEEAIDLEHCLRTLCAGIPDKLVTLVWDPSLSISDADHAHTLFRTVQEALSNSCRHAQANRVDIRMARAGHRIIAEVQDDGIGGVPLLEGNGLKGMRERVSAAGGTLEITDRREGGLSLRICLPLHAGGDHD